MQDTSVNVVRLGGDTSICKGLPLLKFYALYGCVHRPEWDERLPAGYLGSVVFCEARTIVLIPSAHTFAKATTVPTAFLTAYDCLKDTAGIGRKSRVLVHAATGAPQPETKLSDKITTLLSQVHNKLPDCCLSS